MNKKKKKRKEQNNPHTKRYYRKQVLIPFWLEDHIKRQPGSDAAWMRKMVYQGMLGEARGSEGDLEFEARKLAQG